MRCSFSTLQTLTGHDRRRSVEPGISQLATLHGAQRVVGASAYVSRTQVVAWKYVLWRCLLFKFCQSLRCCYTCWQPVFVTCDVVVCQHRSQAKSYQKCCSVSRSRLNCPFSLSCLHPTPVHPTSPSASNMMKLVPPCAS